MWPRRALFVFYSALALFVVVVVVLASKQRRPRSVTFPQTVAAAGIDEIPASLPLPTSELAMPIAGLRAADLRDSFEEVRGGHRHEAIDILAPRGTPVLAVDDGVVKKLFRSIPGGNTVYQFNPAQTYCYYYAHLDRYAEGLAEGQHLRRGDRVGYVGTSGNAPPQTPHLHFAISVLGPEKRWWEGRPIDPYPLLMKSRR